MAYISQITLPTGTTYDIKDAEARELISDLSSATVFLGITTTELEDGSQADHITINGTSKLVHSGDIAIYETYEFIYDGTEWHEFGDLSNLGSLAYQDSASGNFTPSGSVTQPTFSGTAKYLSASVGTATKSMAGTFTPTGTVSQPTFTGTKVYAHHTFTGSANTSTGSFTPSGSVSAPTISVGTAGSTTTVKNPTSKTVVTDMSVSDPSSTTANGELVYCSVSGETLSLKKFVETTGASISTSNVTVKTGDASYTASAPSFTGTAGTVSVSGTASGSVSTTYNSTSTGASGNFTPAGTVSQPTFSGDAGSVSVSGSVANSVTLTTSTTSGTGKVDITPAGTVSQPTFSGTQGTVTVS